MNYCVCDTPRPPSVPHQSCMYQPHQTPGRYCEPSPRWSLESHPPPPPLYSPPARINVIPGTTVTVIDPRDEVLGFADREVTQALCYSMRKNGARFLLGEKASDPAPQTIFVSDSGRKNGVLYVSCGLSRCHRAAFRAFRFSLVLWSLPEQPWPASRARSRRMRAHSKHPTFLHGPAVVVIFLICLCLSVSLSLCLSLSLSLSLSLCVPLSMCLR